MHRHEPQQTSNAAIRQAVSYDFLRQSMSAEQKEILLVNMSRENTDTETLYQREDLINKSCLGTRSAKTPAQLCGKAVANFINRQLQITTFPVS